MEGFWEKLKRERAAEGRPLVVLAPMADVTDIAFRTLFVKYGKPDVMWTEFVACDGLFHTAKKVGLNTPAEAVEYAKEFYLDNDGASRRLAPESVSYGDVAFNHFLKDLQFSKSESPIVAQLFTGNPETMEWASELVARLGFDGVDINMGCPDRSVEKQGSGSALIRNHENARKIIQSAKRGVKKFADEISEEPIPVSVKTRLGYNSDQLEEWLPVLLSENPVVVTIHARTRKEMSKVPARWDRVARAVEIRNELKSNTLIFGNGDILNLEHALRAHEQTSCDGIMIGRGIFGNPWCFNRENDRDKNISTAERLRVMLEHTKLFLKLLPHKNFSVMKKHYKAYVEGFDGAKELRTQLMETQSLEEVKTAVDIFLNQ